MPRTITADYQKALSLSPESPTIRYRLARTRAAMGEYSEAIALLEAMSGTPLDRSGRLVTKDEIARRVTGWREKELNPFGFLAKLQQDAIRQVSGTDG